VDKKDWYCEKCKKDYFDRQSREMARDQEEKGFPPLTGTTKMVSWGLKIRMDLLKKVDYYRQTMSFADSAEEQRADRAFSLLMDRWCQETRAKWWIDHRRMTVKDIVQEMDSLAKGRVEEKKR
jgi:hypothetical protein